MESCPNEFWAVGVQHYFAEPKDVFKSEFCVPSLDLANPGMVSDTYFGLFTKNGNWSSSGMILNIFFRVSEKLWTKSCVPSSTCLQAMVGEHFTSLFSCVFGGQHFVMQNIQEEMVYFTWIYCDYFLLR